MSDHSSLPWQRWQPNDLAQRDRPLIEELTIPEVTEEPADDRQFQLEQLQA